MTLTVGVGGILVSQWCSVLGVSALCVGILGTAVGCSGMVREKDQEDRCDEKEQAGSHQ